MSIDHNIIIINLSLIMLIFSQDGFILASNKIFKFVYGLIINPLLTVVIFSDNGWKLTTFIFWCIHGHIRGLPKRV